MTAKAMDEEEGRRVCEAATAGPLVADEDHRGGYNIHGSWHSVHQEHDEIEPGVFSMLNKPELAMFHRVEDARLFAYARTALPAALDEIETLRKERNINAENARIMAKAADSEKADRIGMRALYDAALRDLERVRLLLKETCGIAETFAGPDRRIPNRKETLARLVVIRKDGGL